MSNQSLKLDAKKLMNELYKNSDINKMNDRHLISEKEIVDECNDSYDYEYNDSYDHVYDEFGKSKQNIKLNHKKPKIKFRRNKLKTISKNKILFDKYSEYSEYFEC